MAMTIAEKILAAHSGVDHVEPGDLIVANLDLTLSNDVTSPLAIQEFYKSGAKKVFDKERVTIVPDHFTPNKDIKSAEQCKYIRNFCKDMDIKNYFEVGEVGIEHVLLPEKGLVLPGDLIIGADSHTCTYGALGAFSTGVGSTDLGAAMITGKAWFKVPETIRFNLTGELQGWASPKDVILYIIGMIGVDGALYKAMEFGGEGLKNISIEGRMTISNMAIEAGGKAGIFEVDEQTLEFVDARKQREYKVFAPDADAKYEKVIDIDLSKIEPQVAFPPLPENTRTISEVGDIDIDQVVIGSCTNGRMEDLRIAAQIMKGKKVAKYIRCIILPGTQLICKQAIKEGLVDIFIDAGAAFSTPTCGPCLGGHMGILAEGERAVATTNRNFVGRMGHPKSEVYLASPAVAAASALTGKISGPEEVV